MSARVTQTRRPLKLSNRWNWNPIAGPKELGHEEKIHQKS